MKVAMFSAVGRRGTSSRAADASDKTGSGQLPNGCSSRVCASTERAHRPRGVLKCHSPGRSQRRVVSRRTPLSLRRIHGPGRQAAKNPQKAATPALLAAYSERACCPQHDEDQLRRAVGRASRAMADFAGEPARGNGQRR